MTERKMTINIYYDDGSDFPKEILTDSYNSDDRIKTKEGLCYRDYDYEADDKMESRDVAFLIAVASAHIMLDDPIIEGGVS